MLSLEADLRQPAHARAGGDHDGLLGVVRFLLAVGALDRDAGRGPRRLDDAPRAADPGDLVLLEQELDALGVLRG